MTARDLSRHLGRFPALSAHFFAGGVGRALAWSQVGPLHPAIVARTASKLVLPLVFIAFCAITRRV